MHRSEALDTVKKLTTEDRNQTHGDPIVQFQTAQALKRVLLLEEASHLNPVEIECIQTICTKLSRLRNGQPHDPAKWIDHWLDIIGYAAIAVESHHMYNSTTSESQGTYIAGSDKEAVDMAAKLAPKLREDYHTIGPRSDS